MSIPIPVKMCERPIMNAMGRVVRPSGMRERTLSFFFAGILKRGFQVFTVAATAFSGVAETTNAPASTNAPAATAAASPVTESALRPLEAASPSASSSRGFDESAFRIVAERNIFNANRSGGRVRLSSARRPARVESFTLVGTLAYEKGAFAFFEGSSTEFSKVVKAGGVIASHKVVDVLANAVKLEADGKILELPVGSAMRREDEGTWHLGEGVAGNGGATYVSNRENGPSGQSSRGDLGSRSSRSNRHESGSDSGRGSESAPGAATTSSNSSADQSEILKRLMERREKESQ